MITVAFFCLLYLGFKKEEITHLHNAQDLICYYSNLVMNVSGKKSQLVKPLVQ